MKIRSFLVPLSLLLFLALTIAACELSVSTANIKSATLAKDYVEGKAVNSTTVFAPEDGVFHLVVEVANAPDDTTVKAAWHLVEAEGYEPSLIDEATMTLESGQDVVDFTLSAGQLWPVGKYKVELYLNDKLDRTLEFQVQ